VVKRKIKSKRVKLTKDQKNTLKLFCISCAVFVLLFISFFNIKTLLSPKKVLGTQTEAKIEELKNLRTEEKYWEDFLVKNPTYLDGWIELTRIEIEIGNNTKAKEVLAKAREIDPNSPKIIGLGKLLE
jgi:cytochrome c-type biogenesis protein CcmH/NrfG